MFLNESYNTAGAIGSMEIYADPVCGYQICLEAENAWHKMEMQMVKLEHTAIVNNNMSLLSEGEDGWWDKTKEWFKTLGQTFLRYLDKVIDKWQEIQMRIKSRWIDVSKMMSTIKSNDKLKDKSVPIDMTSIQVGIKFADAGNKIVDEVKKMGEDNGSYKGSDRTEFSAGEVIAKIFDSAGMRGMNVANITTSTQRLKGSVTTGNVTPIKLTDEKSIKTVLDFLKDKRAKAIEVLKKARNEGAKLINRGINSSTAREEETVKIVKHEVSVFKGVMNAFIIGINKASVQALKVLSIASSKGMTDTKFDKKMQNLNNRVFESAMPYNILDQF